VNYDNTDRLSVIFRQSVATQENNWMSNDMDAPKIQELSPALFFRAFDLAFFIPGSLILIQLLYEFRKDKPWEMVMKGDEKTAQSILLVAGFVILSFVLGLVCHAIHRLLYGFAESYLIKCAKATESAKVYSQEDLARTSYFWYLRSTSWNTAASLLLCGLIKLYIKTPFSSCWPRLLVQCSPYLLASLLFVYLGCDYHRAYKRRSESIKQTLLKKRN
jgi:hypothetical protein